MSAAFHDHAAEPMRDAPPREPAAHELDGDLWPLPLTTFEKYMFYDDHPEYPMVNDVFCTFAGTIRREAFEQGLKFAVRQHPLLRVLVDETRGKQLHWTPTAHLPAVDWGRFDEPFTDSAQRIDLRREPGLRIGLRYDDERTCIHARFHHACCDGKGMMQFLESWMAGYAEACGEPVPGPGADAYETGLLRRRNDWGRIHAPRLPWLRDRWRRLKDAVRFLWQSPRPLTIPPRGSQVSHTSPVLPGLATRTFDEAESSALRAAVGGGRGTLNDACIAALLRTLRAWDREHGVSDGRQRHRILMPHDLRIAGDERLPAANVMSFGFITREVAESDGADILPGVRDETQMVRQGRYALDFVQAMEEIDRTGRLETTVRKQRCLATAVLTNLSDPTRRFRHRFPRRQGKCVAGNLVLEAINAAGPLRSLTRVGVCVSVYCGRIVIDLRCDPRHYTAEDSARLLALFECELLRPTTA